MDFKDIYLAEVERITADLEDQGLDPNRAYDIASNTAYDSARESLLDRADHLRAIAKEG